jgi:hypothetical protein
MLAFAIFIAVACGVREHWNRLRNDDPVWSAFFRRWLIQGAIIPAAAWAIVNLGVFKRFPPLIPRIAIAQNAHDPWFSFWVNSSIRGGAFVVVCWGAVTYVWMILVIAREFGKSNDFRFAIKFLGIPLFLIALLISYRAPWTMLPFAVLLVLMPVTHRSLNVVEKRAPVPMYGAAQGKINFGKYEAAEAEVIHQLEKKDNDFNGWMMLAELYATKYRRMEDAAQVVVDMCRDPSITEVEASIACNRLADWQLEIGMNPAAARAALDLLIQRAPESHVAKMAALRLKQMPRTREDLLDQQKPKSIRLPALREESATAKEEGAGMSQSDASLEANRLSDRLRHEPNDVEARERLAIVLAEGLGQVSVGIEQLRLMINLPDVSGERAAKWLAQMASWERRLNKNEAKFIALLNEIIRVYPGTTHALSARRQLQLMEEQKRQPANAEGQNIPPIKIRVGLPEV